MREKKVKDVKEVEVFDERGKMPSRPRIERYGGRRKLAVVELEERRDPRCLWRPKKHGTARVGTLGMLWVPRKNKEPEPLRVSVTKGGWEGVEIKLEDQPGGIRQGMSGAVLEIEGEFAGLLMNATKTGGVVMTSREIEEAVGEFFAEDPDVVEMKKVIGRYTEAYRKLRSDGVKTEFPALSPYDLGKIDKAFRSYRRYKVEVKEPEASTGAKCEDAGYQEREDKEKATFGAVTGQWEGEVVSSDGRWRKFEVGICFDLELDKEGVWRIVDVRDR